MTDDLAVATIATPEISEPVAVESLLPFSKRLRSALEALPEGEAITLRTKKERSQIANITTNLRKAKGLYFSTSVLNKRENEPEGYLILKIRRLTQAEIEAK